MKDKRKNVKVDEHVWTMQNKKKVEVAEDVWNKFKKLCYIQCTQEEICSILEMSAHVLNNRINDQYGCGFADIYNVFKAPGKASVRRSQMKMSRNNATMAIWLGKVYLGQKDYEDDRVNLNTALGILDKIKEIRIVDDNADAIKKAST